MPLKATQSAQLTTFEQAQAIVQKLVSKGIPTIDLRENSPQNGVVSTSDPNFQSDGLPYQYIVNVWGKDQIVGLLGVALANYPPFQAFVEIATSSNPLDRVWAIMAVVGLPVVTAAINDALKV